MPTSSCLGSMPYKVRCLGMMSRQLGSGKDIADAQLMRRCPGHEGLGHMLVLDHDHGARLPVVAQGVDQDDMVLAVEHREQLKAGCAAIDAFHRGRAGCSGDLTPRPPGSLPLRRRSAGCRCPAPAPSHHALQSQDLDLADRGLLAVDQVDGAGQAGVKGVNGAQYLERQFGVGDRDCPPARPRRDRAHLRRCADQRSRLRERPPGSS